jgi:hypothetical protein
MRCAQFPEIVGKHPESQRCSSKAQPEHTDLSV